MDTFIFPGKVKIQLIDQLGRSLRIRNILIDMKLRSGTKNSYAIMFPPTNNRGITALSRNQVREQIESENEYFRAYYNGAIHKCHPIVEIRLFNVRRFRTFLNKTRGWLLSNYEPQERLKREKTINSILSSRNSEFKAHQLVDLSKLRPDASIKLTMIRRPRTKGR